MIDNIICYCSLAENLTLSCLMLLSILRHWTLRGFLGITGVLSMLLETPVGLWLYHTNPNGYNIFYALHNVANCLFLALIYISLNYENSLERIVGWLILLQLYIKALIFMEQDFIWIYHFDSFLHYSRESIDMTWTILLIVRFYNGLKETHDAQTSTS